MASFGCCCIRCSIELNAMTTVVMMVASGPRERSASGVVVVVAPRQLDQAAAHEHHPEANV